MLTGLSTDCVGNCDGDRPSPRSHLGRVLLQERRVLIVGAPPSVRRVKPEHRASRCSHPGRVLLQERRVLNVGAPPPVRRVSQNTEPAVVHTRSGCSYGWRVLNVGAPPPVRRVKPEHRAGRCSHPERVLLRLARVECRSTAPGAKGEARAPSRPLFAPGAGAPTQEARVDCRSTALGAKGEARTPSRPLFAPGAGAPTGEAHVV